MVLSYRCCPEKEDFFNCNNERGGFKFGKSNRSSWTIFFVFEKGNPIVGKDLKNPPPLYSMIDRKKTYSAPPTNKKRTQTN